MKSPLLAALLTVLGSLTYYKVGTPVVRAYPSSDGTMVVKLTLSRMPGFVAYFRTSGGRALGSGVERSG